MLLESEWADNTEKSCKLESFTMINKEDNYTHFNIMDTPSLSQGITTQYDNDYNSYDIILKIMKKSTASYSLSLLNSKAHVYYLVQFCV